MFYSIIGKLYSIKCRVYPFTGLDYWTQNFVVKNFCMFSLMYVTLKYIK